MYLIVENFLPSVSALNINTISVLLFIYPVYKYNSYRSLILLINGLIFHGYIPDNKYMLYFDSICCGAIALYCLYQAPHTFKTGFSFTLFSIANIFLRRFNYHKSDFLLYQFCVCCFLLLLLILNNKWTTNKYVILKCIYIYVYIV